MGALEAPRKQDKGGQSVHRGTRRFNYWVEGTVGEMAAEVKKQGTPIVTPSSHPATLPPRLGPCPPPPPPPPTSIHIHTARRSFLPAL